MSSKNSNIPSGSAITATGIPSGTITIGPANSTTVSTNGYIPYTSYNFTAESQSIINQIEALLAFITPLVSEYYLIENKTRKTKEVLPFKKAFETYALYKNYLDDITFTPVNKEAAKTLFGTPNEEK